MSQNTTLIRDTHLIVNDIWSPSEVFALDPQCDMLNRSLSPLSVEDGKVFAVRSSSFFAPFESLQSKWAPSSTTPESRSRQALPQSVTCTPVSWDKRDLCGECVIADLCRSCGWIRITSSFPDRQFVVERSSSQLRAVIAAIQYSFPELLVPTSEQESAECLGVMFCNFFMTHAVTFSSFLPTLFFFYELQEKEGISFFTVLENEVRARRAQEQLLLDALKPKESRGWFSRGSSKPPEPGAGTSTQDLLIWLEGSSSACVPPELKPLFTTALGRKEKCTHMQQKANVLCDEIVKELTWRQELATDLSVSSQTNEPVAGCYSPEELAAAKKESADVKRCTGLIQQIIFNSSFVSLQVAEPVIRSFLEISDQLVVAAVSILRYTETYLCMKKIVSENAPYFGGGGHMALPKGCTATSSPGVLKQVTDLHNTYAHILIRWESVLLAEVQQARSFIVRLQRLQCSFYYTLVTALLNGYSPVHHAGLISDPPHSSFPTISFIQDCLPKEYSIMED